MKVNFRLDQSVADPAGLPDGTAQLGQWVGDLVEAPTSKRAGRTAIAPRPATLENRDGGHDCPGRHIPSGGYFDADCLGA